MYLVERKEQREVISAYMLNDYLKDGWNLVRHLKDCPARIQTIRVNKRKPEDIIEWYEQQISQVTERLIDLRWELKWAKRLEK